MWQSTRRIVTLEYKRFIVRAILVVTVLIPGIGPTLAMADANTLDEIPLPPNSERRIVATNVLQHGHRMSMATLHSSAPVEALLDFYRSSWNSTESSLPGYIEEKAGDWRIISRIEDGWNRVVQIRDGNRGREAYLSVMKVEPDGVSSTSNPLPRDGVLVSSLTGEEFNKPVKTDVVFSKQRESAVAGFYRDHFTKAGWSIVSDRKAGTATVMLMQRNGAQAEVVVTPVRDGSVAVLNKVGKDG